MGGTTSLGEAVQPEGSIAGHRFWWLFYRRALPPEAFAFWRLPSGSHRDRRSLERRGGRAREGPPGWPRRRAPRHATLTACRGGAPPPCSCACCRGGCAATRATPPAERPSPGCRAAAADRGPRARGSRRFASPTPPGGDRRDSTRAAGNSARRCASRTPSEAPILTAHTPRGVPATRSRPSAVATMT